MRVSQNFRRSFKPPVVTRLNDKHRETLTWDARELCWLAQACLSIIPRAAAVSEQLTPSPRLISRSAHYSRRGEDNVAM